MAPSACELQENYISQNVPLKYGPGSSVSIVTDYGLGGPEIESRWWRDFLTCPDRPRGPPSLLYNGYRLFSGGKERPGRDADPSPLLVPWSRKSGAIPLLPLWAVRPVQSLSACTRVHYTILRLVFQYLLRFKIMSTFSVCEFYFFSFLCSFFSNFCYKVV